MHICHAEITLTHMCPKQRGVEGRLDIRSADAHAHIQQAGSCCFIFFHSGLSLQRLSRGKIYKTEEKGKNGTKTAGEGHQQTADKLDQACGVLAVSLGLLRVLGVKAADKTLAETIAFVFEDEKALLTQPMTDAVVSETATYDVIRVLKSPFNSRKVEQQTAWNSHSQVIRS